MIQKRRTYADGCPVAQALDIVGDRWGLLVVRELVFGPKRFSDLRDALAGIAPNMLSQRLADLEEGGVARKASLPPPARVQVYELTDWGRAIAPVLTELARWAVANPRLRQGLPLSVSATVLTMQGMFDPAAAKGQALALELRLEGQVFRLDVAKGRLEVGPGPHPAPQAVVTGEASLLLAMLREGRSLKKTVAAGLTVEGDKAAVKAFARLFAAPAPALPS